MHCRVHAHFPVNNSPEFRAKACNVVVNKRIISCQRGWHRFFFNTFYAHRTQKHLWVSQWIMQVKLTPCSCEKRFLPRGMQRYNFSSLINIQQCLALHPRERVSNDESLKVWKLLQFCIILHGITDKINTYITSLIFKIFNTQCFLFNGR